MKKKTLFFVYGTLKAGQGNHRRIERAKLLGEFATTPNYTMVSLGGYPAVFCTGNTSIKGEVYETEDEDIVRGVHALEGYSGNPGPHNHFYDLEEIDTPYGKAGMFVFRDNHDINSYRKVESGNWER